MADTSRFKPYIIIPIYIDSIIGNNGFSVTLISNMYISFLCY